MIELAVALGWRLGDVLELELADLATLIDVLEAREAAASG
jgi:hypothetical protein